MANQIVVPANEHPTDNEKNKHRLGMAGGQKKK